MTTTAERAVNRWNEIFEKLEIPPAILNKRHQPCPFCGGKDRFRYTDYKGWGCWICSHCGSGNGFNFLMNYFDWTFPDAARKVDEIIGVRVTFERRKPNTAEDIWRKTKPIRPRDPVGRYLINRVGITTFPSVLRTAENVYYEPSVYYPCMVARLTAPNGHPSTVHRTYITEDGKKAPVESPKKFVAGSIETGSALRLTPIFEHIGIAEGAETALAVTKLFGVPCWATMTSILMAKWIPPNGVKSITIYGDRDSSYAGQAAAYTLAHRVVGKIKVDIKLPSEVDTDWLDILERKIHG
jgi:putative DNA primase/helicase